MSFKAGAVGKDEAIQHGGRGDAERLSFIGENKTRHVEGVDVLAII